MALKIFIINSQKNIFYIFIYIYIYFFLLMDSGGKVVIKPEIKNIIV